MSTSVSNPPQSGKNSKAPSPERTEIFNRTALLTGLDYLEDTDRLRGIVFGMGGVGSWAAETLVRSGFSKLTIVDADVVAVSNINRQLPATVSTVGRVKVDVMERKDFSQSIPTPRLPPSMISTTPPPVRPSALRNMII